MGRPDLRPLDIDRSGNGQRVRTLEFDLADAVMLAHAVSVCGAEAMLSQAPAALRRLQHYKEFFLSLLPEDAKLFDRDTDLCEIAIMAQDSETWTIHRVREHTWSDGRVVVTVGGRRFVSSWIHKAEAVDRMAAVVELLMPVTCVRVPKEDEDGYPWSVR